MGSQQIIIRQKDCAEPEINRLLTAYCFGHASESERQSVEAHLLECDHCWHEAQRLEAGVRVLDTDRSVLQTLTPAEIASALGLSGKLNLPFGGHLSHALIASGLYAALYAVGLLGEIAYQFDRYGRASLWVAAAIFTFVFVTSLAGLAVDWKLTRDGSRKGIAASAAIFLGSALLVFAGACLFLPTNPVTEMNWQTYTAQAAYLKDIVYFLVLLVIFLLPPFHFVLAMQRELQSGRHKSTLSLLTGDKLSLTPRSVYYPRFWVLALILAVIVGVSFFLHHNLMSNLKPGEYMNLFANLIHARLILYHLLATVCLYWYYHALNELKRECVLAERLAEQGWASSHS